MAKEKSKLWEMAKKHAVDHACRKKDWLELLADSRPELADEIAELMDDFLKGGEMAKTFRSRAQFARFLCSIEGVDFAPHTIATWISRHAGK
jgi:hypothetical protein